MAQSSLGLEERMRLSWDCYIACGRQYHLHSHQQLREVSLNFPGVLLNRNIQANHAIALLDALDEPEKTDLTDIWPPPISEPDIIVNPVGNDIPGRQRSPYEFLQDAVRTRNKKVVRDLRQLVMCPLLQDIGEDMGNISCGHYFSRKLIEAWLAQTTQSEERGQNCGRHRKSHAATVVGVKYDFMRDVVLIKDWFSDASFAIPSVVYVNDTADEIISWGGGQAPSDSSRATFFSKPYSIQSFPKFMSALFAKIKSYLNRGVAAPLRQNIKAKYLFCIPDQFCRNGNNESIFLRALNSAGWDASTVEIVPETKCGAIFALDLNAGGIRRPNQVLQVLCWDYFGVSQRVYKLCPEDRFGIWEVGPEEADHRVLILAEIESRIGDAIDGESDLKAGSAVENEDRFPRELVGRVFDDDLFDASQYQDRGRPNGAMFFYENYLYGDLMRTYSHAKKLTLSCNVGCHDMA
ncbi:hypothetical protein V1515DRAFT_586982 [Lipomyces mesembrius]